MANYDVTICGIVSGVTVDFGSATINEGDVWSFSGSNGELYCGTVDQESLRPASYTAITQYDTCFDCLTGSSESNLLQFKLCGRDGIALQLNVLEFGVAKYKSKPPNPAFPSVE
jgi:hypothetical protein